MTPTITPRVPDIDWSQDVDRYWGDVSPRVAHWYDALSMLFPLGEKFFRDTALEVMRGLDLSGNPELLWQVRAFAVQETAHSAQHANYNAILAKQGFSCVVEDFIHWWLAWGQRHISVLTRLAVVCTYEHYTAVMVEDLLHVQRRWMKRAPDMALLWGWHALEETEHKAVCFDLYQAAGGGWLRRVVAFCAVSIGFNVFLLGRQYWHLMRQERAMKRPPRPAFEPADSAGTDAPAAATPNAAHARRRAWFDPGGVNVAALLSFLKPSFHPWQRDNRAHMQAWLKANEGRLRVIGRADGGTAQPVAP